MKLRATAYDVVLPGGMGRNPAVYIMTSRFHGTLYTGVVTCTLPYEDRFTFGETLASSTGKVMLNHPHCARFCVLGEPAAPREALITRWLRSNSLPIGLSRVVACGKQPLSAAHCGSAHESRRDRSARSPYRFLCGR